MSGSSSRNQTSAERLSVTVGHDPEHTTDMKGPPSHGDNRCRCRRAPELPPRGGRSDSPSAAARRSSARSRSAGPPPRHANASKRRESGVFGGLPRGPLLHAQDTQGVKSVEGGAIGDVTWVRSRETHPGPHRVVRGWPPTGRWRDNLPRLPLHRDHPELRREGQPAGFEVHVHDRHARPPDRRRGTTRSPWIRFESGASGQFGSLDVPRRMDSATRLRDPRTIWSTTSCGRASRCLLPAAGAAMSGEGQTTAGWLSPSRRMYRSSATSTCSRTCSRPCEESAPAKTFYDGYVVNAVMDACYRSAKTGLGTGRAVQCARRFDAADCEVGRDVRRPTVIKRELLPDGRSKLILKDPATVDYPIRWSSCAETDRWQARSGSRRWSRRCWDDPARLRTDRPVRDRRRAFGSRRSSPTARSSRCCGERRLVVKLDRRRVDELIESGTRALRSGHGRLQKEWLDDRVRVGHVWLAWRRRGKRRPGPVGPLAITTRVRLRLGSQLATA